MPNVLKREKQIAVLHMLSEGSSMRSVNRITGVDRNTIARLLVRFGLATDRFLDVSMHSIHATRVEMDEIWTFVQKKEKRCSDREKRAGNVGDQYLFTALADDSKLLFSYVLGRRTSETTQQFVDDVESRLVRSPVPGAELPELLTDGWGPYVPAIANAFGGSAAHGVITKRYTNPEVGRYAPPEMRKTERENVYGIRNLATICTSHVERLNLSIRTFMRRFTRLALGFSKKLENLYAATALHVGTYNFVKRHRSLEGCTPAMVAGLTDTLWSMDEFYDNVMEHDRQWRQRQRNQRLVDRLRGE